MDQRENQKENYIYVQSNEVEHSSNLWDKVKTELRRGKKLMWNSIIIFKESKRIKRVCAHPKHVENILNKKQVGNGNS